MLLFCCLYKLHFYLKASLNLGIIVYYILKFKVSLASSSLSIIPIEYDLIKFSSFNNYNPA